MTLWILLSICVLVSFVFSGLEAGILSVNPVRVRHQAEQGDRTALVLQSLLARKSRMLVTILLVTNAMNISALILGAGWFHSKYGAAGYLLLLIVALPFFVLVIELLPKSIFRRFPMRLLALFVPLLRLAAVILLPLLQLGSWLARLMPGLKHRERRSMFAAREHFKYLTALSERHGALSPTERRMIHGVLDFRNVTVAHVMIPLEQVATLPANSTVAEALALGREKGVERIPVLGPDGKVVGLLNLFEVLVDRAEYRGIGPHVRKLILVSPGEQAYSVLRKLRAARLRVAGVTDREGKLLGIAREEDLVGRLVSAAAPA
jgi:putative hemolysin